MTSVSLGTVWLNDAADPSDRIRLTLMSSLSVATRKDGEVRKGAAGRRRVVVRAGRDTGFDLTAEGLEREQLDWLEDHVGRDLWVRDDRGRRLGGVFFEVPVEEHQYDERGDVSLSLSGVTFGAA